MSHHITFHCRTISPMFLGGANSDQAELRAPSVKGVLRFWERAIARHLIFDNGREDHIRLLRNDEGLFGGVFTTQEKSKVSVSIAHGPLNNTITGRDLINNNAGLKYLLFTLAVHNTEKKGIAANFPFRVTLRCEGEDTEAFQKAIAAFWALTYFGALGTRARRGAGAFEVTASEGFALPAGISFSPHGDVAAFLQNGLGTAHRLFGVPESTASPKGYSTIGKEVWVSKKGRQKWEEALEEIGKLMLDHRKAIPNPDRSKRKFTMETLDQKAAFGLPVGVFSDNEVNFAPREDGYSRRASPLIITLMRANTGIHWVVVHLEGEFMEEKDKIVFNSRNHKARCKKDHTWDKENPQLLKEFTRKLDQYAYKIY